MNITIQNINEEELNNFIQMMDGYAGIWDSDKSWMQDENSRSVQITLYCYLISNGTFYFENQNLNQLMTGI